MTIKAKLLISSILEILLVILVSVSLIVSSSQIKKTNNNEIRATNIVQAITEIRFVTFENLLHHDDRSFEQWQLKHQDLTRLLEPLPSQSPDERVILDGILKQSQDVYQIFTRLAASYDQPVTAQNAANQKTLQDLLATQLMTDQQSQISEAIKLASMDRDQANVLRQQANWLVLLVILMMVVIMATNYFFIAGSITKAIAVLQKGAEEITGGKFSYRIKYNSKANELGRLAIAFNSMAASLEQIDNVKTDFILLASHQLRTPLTAIKWTSEELLFRSKAMEPSKQKRYIKQLHASNQRMIELVSALLEVAKIDLGLGIMRAKPEPVEVSLYLEQVLKDLSAQILKKKIIIQKDIDKNLPRVLIDPNWARLIIQNLLTNAIKYSSSGQLIGIAIKQQHKHILFEVADNGCGIPAVQQDRVFSKLFRADNAQKLVSDGSGLGLYMAKAMVEEAGGTIWFDSVEDQGTVFYVKLPCINKDN